MASEYSTPARLEEMVDGEKDDTWGGITNTNLNLLEEYAGGYVSVALTGATKTLSSNNAATDENRPKTCNFTGTPGATCTVTVADVEHQRLYINNSDQSAIIDPGGTTVTIPAGESRIVYTDGATNAVDGLGLTSTAFATSTPYTRTFLDDATAAAATTTLGLGTGDSPQFTAINLGHASDTTFARVSAGIASIEGNNIITANIVASLTVAGVIEIATGAETNTGTDATRAVSPDGLDDWTGSAQVTTLGTIATGVWQGTAINQTYLTGQSGTNTGDEVAASLTAAGVIEIATGAETNTGTDATRAVSPDGLDDWTGSAQVTTLGTIASGTWQGTAINQTYLVGQSGTNTGDEVAASLTAAGVIEIATVAETNTGTDATRAVSPDGLDGWTGSAQVTTLGTIATGVWNGTAIDLTSYVTGDLPFANIAQLGAYELAMRNAGTTGDIAGVKISELTLESSPTTGDWLLLEDAAGILKYINWSSLPGIGSGAPSDAQYLTLAANGTLSAERLLALGTGLAGVDSGAGLDYTVSPAFHNFTLDDGTIMAGADWLMFIDATDNTIYRITATNFGTDMGFHTGTIAVASGGTGATSAGDARSNLGLAIGSNVQSHDANLDQIAALAVTDSNFIVGNGSAWVVESGATVRQSLGLTIGTDVQTQGAVLDDFNTLGAASADGEFIVATAAGAFAYESGATVRTSLGLGTTNSPQFTGIELGHATDTTLTRQGAGDVNIEGNIVYRAGGTDVPVADGGTGVSTLTDGGVLLGSGTGAVTAMSVLADGEFIVGDGTTDPVAESGATLRTSIGVGTGDSPQFTGIELGHATDTTLSRGAAGELHVEGVPVKMPGKETVGVPAGAMRPTSTNGALASLTELATNDVMLDALRFDADTLEKAQFGVPMPKSWDEGTVTAQFFWTHVDGATFTVVWGLRAVAFGDGDALDAAMGTGQTVADTGGTNDDGYWTPETSAITIAGSPAEGDWVIFEVYRDAADGSDGHTTDAYLIGVKLHFTTDAKDDT